VISSRPCATCASPATATGSALGALDEPPAPDPAGRPFDRALRAALGEAVLSERTPHARVLTDDLDLTLTATQAGERYTITLAAGHLDPAGAVPAGLWLTVRAGRLALRHLARLDEAGHAEFAGVPAGEWRFDVIAAAGEAEAIPLPVVRPVPHAIAAAGGGYSVALPGRIVLLLTEPTGAAPYVLELLSPGGPMKVFRIRYQDTGDRPRALLVPGAHRSQVRLRDFAPARPWSVADVTGEPADPELVRASVEAAGDKVTALAWRALGHEAP
jgi:hypothetical protein